jgi:GlcNAc-PI de-N-acetylase
MTPRTGNGGTELVDAGRAPTRKGASVPSAGSWAYGPIPTTRPIWPAGCSLQRRRELRRALDLLGVGEHHWLAADDGRCQAADGERQTAQLRTIIDAFRADTIITFGPHGFTGHPDHVRRVVGRPSSR